MFYVDKNTLPRYWWAYAGHVEERIGTSCSNEGEFATEREAVAYADRLMQERTTREYVRISRRFSGVYLAVCHVRALWNEKIRDGLARYKASFHRSLWLATRLPQYPCKANVLPSGLQFTSSTTTTLN
jgi:hypothetical protein